MIKLELVILGVPLAKQSFKFTRTGHKYQPAKVIENCQNIRAQIANQLPKPFKPFSVRVEVLSLTFVFPALKSFKKADKLKIECGELLPKTTKPDCDNLLKEIFDSMAGIVFLNDALIWKINNISKVYGQKPCIMLTVIGE